MNQINIKNIGVKLSYHIVFWVLIYFSYTYFLGYGSTETGYVNLFSGFLMPVSMVLSYLLIYYLIPKYLLAKKYKIFILYSAYAAVITVYLIILSVLYGMFFLSDMKMESTTALTKSLPLIIFAVFFVALIVVTLSMIKYSYQSAIKNETLEKKFLKTELELKANELKFLKMQIHPHFLFNTLNTMYGFALKKADETPEMILKLSNLLDYILYQVNKPKVFLKDEIQHIEDYLELEKLRFHDTLRVDMKVENIPDSFQVTPMLLIPFIENSFKHGAILDGKLLIDVELQVIDNWLYFKIENTTNSLESNNKGIGLNNLRKRLEILYQGNFELKVKKIETRFVAELKVLNISA
mgnify:CR=1 FL=1